MFCKRKSALAIYFSKASEIFVRKMSEINLLNFFASIVYHNFEIFHTQQLLYLSFLIVALLVSLYDAFTMMMMMMIIIIIIIVIVIIITIIIIIIIIIIISITIIIIIILIIFLSFFLSFNEQYI